MITLKMKQCIKAGILILATGVVSSWDVRAQEAHEQDTLRSVTMEEVVISSHRPGTLLSSLSSFKTETITQTLSHIATLTKVTPLSLWLMVKFYHIAREGVEQLGLALNDLIHWVRYPFNPVVGKMSYL
jgi:hypothetical protein